MHNINYINDLNNINYMIAIFKIKYYKFKL